MKETLAGSRPLLSLAFCLWCSPALAASQGASTQPSPAAAQTSAPGCAKLVCQRRTPGLDVGASAEPAIASRAPVALRFGVGAAGFRGPAADSGVYPYELAIDGSPIYGTRRAKLDGAGLWLGVSLEQELSSAALHWGLEERSALSTVLALDGSSSITGAMDVLVSAREGSLPLRLAIGPSLAVAQIDMSDASTRLPEAIVIVSGAASLRWDPRGLPVAFDLTGHLGKSLNLGGDCGYRDLELALALPL